MERYRIRKGYVNYEGISQGAAKPTEDIKQLANMYHEIADELNKDPTRFEHERRLRIVANELESIVDKSDNE